MILKSSKGKEVNSPFRDTHEAIRALKKLHDEAKIPLHSVGFAKALLSASSSPRGLSHDQTVWVHILATEHRPPDLLPAYTSIDGSKINLLFAVADQKGLRKPRIRLMNGRLAIRLGRRSGLIEVVRVGNPSTILGSITRGLMDIHAKATPEEAAEIQRFCEDPHRGAVLFGKTTGRCIFCGLYLSTPESVGNGYGPVCADNYGLPWSDSEGAKHERAMREMLELKEKLLNEVTQLPPDVAAAVLAPLARPGAGEL